MKQLYLLFAMLIFSACSKDELIGPLTLKNGQEVEVLVSHKYGATVDPLLVLPSNQPAEMSLYSFTDREPGYNYGLRQRLLRQRSRHKMDRLTGLSLLKC